MSDSDEDLESFFKDSSSFKPKRKAVKKKAVPRKRKPTAKRPAKKKLQAGEDKELPVTDSSPDTRDQLAAVRQFFESVKDTDKPIYVGIDPGTKGAIALLHPDNADLHTAVDLPVLKVAKSTKTKKGNTSYKQLMDVATIWEYFKCMLPVKSRVVICLEKMQPMGKRDTGVTGFGVGYAYGIWPLFLHSHGFVLEEILPNAWKRAMGLIKKDKADSRLMAQRLFPSAPLLRVCDDGRAEAFLVAETIKRRRSQIE